MGQKVYLSGEARYPKLYGEGDVAYKNWQIEVALDKESQKRFDESGMTLEGRKQDDGKVYYKFRRPHGLMIKGKATTFEPPKVMDKDQKPITDLVGNGSLVTIKVEVYDTVKGKGHRLEAVRVDKLVPYEPPAEGARSESAVLPPLVGEAF